MEGKNVTDEFTEDTQLEQIHIHMTKGLQYSQLVLNNIENLKTSFGSIFSFWVALGLCKDVT